MATDKKPRATKIYGMGDIEFDKLNPDNIIAKFHVRIPKDCKMFGKCVNKKEYREIANHVYIQPSTGKLLATDTFAIARADVECNGQWPEDAEEVKGDVSILKRYIAPISADAMCKYAGQEIDVTTYRQDGKSTTLITSDTAVAAISSVSINSSTNYPDWQRYWLEDEQYVEKIKLTPGAVRELRKWIAYGSNINIEINISKNADNVQFSLWYEDRGKWDQEKGCCVGEPLEDKDALYCDIESGQPQHDIHMTFDAGLFRINIMDGFNGELWFERAGHPVRFCGEQRESILMPRKGVRDKFE